MEMHQVRYFIAVARTLNFTRAAEECHVAQPSLTFARNGHGAALLPSGDVIVFGGQLTTGYGTSLTEIWHPSTAGAACRSTWRSPSTRSTPARTPPRA